jgi:hypothetical protein
MYASDEAELMLVEVRCPRFSKQSVENSMTTHSLSPPIFLQVRPYAALMQVDDTVAGPGVGRQGQPGTREPSPHAGAGQAAGLGDRRGRSASKSGGESGGDNSRMDLGGAELRAGRLRGAPTPSRRPSHRVGGETSWIWGQKAFCARGVVLLG